MSMLQSFLTPSSVLYWLVLLVGVGIIWIGARFIVAPVVAARDFGVPAPSDQRFTYLWAKGTRDIVSGLIAIGLLLLGASPAVLAAFLFIASLIPLGDLVNVYANVGTTNKPAIFIHGGTAVFMWVLAALILRA